MACVKYSCKCTNVTISPLEYSFVGSNQTFSAIKNRDNDYLEAFNFIQEKLAPIDDSSLISKQFLNSNKFFKIINSNNYVSEKTQANVDEEQHEYMNKLINQSIDQHVSIVN